MLYYLRRFLSKQKPFIIILIILSILFVFFATSIFILGYKNNNMLTKKNNIMAKYNQLNGQIEDQNAVLFDSKMKADFTKTQLKEISQKHLSYSLFINGIPLSKNTNIIYIKTSKLEIILSEIIAKDATDFIPKDILDSGSLLTEQNILSLINISANKATVKTKLQSNESGKILNYNFSNVKLGEVISLQLDSFIAQKLGITNNIIEIVFSATK